MRIAHLVSTFYPHQGGMGQICYEEARHLALAGNDVTVLTLRYPGDQSEEARVGFRIKRLSSRLRLGDGGIMCGLDKYLSDFDVVHLHYPFYGSAHLLARWSRKTGRKYIISYHMDVQSGRIKRWLAGLYDWLWSKYILSTASRVIFVDQPDVERFRAWLSLEAGKTTVIPNAVDSQVFSPRPVERKNLLPADWATKKIILFVGNALPVKRLDLLLKSLVRLEADVGLVVIGGGYEIGRYRRLAERLNLSNRVLFIENKLQLAALAEYYNLAWCTVIPSDYESFSLVALESMACGCPVIGSNNAALRRRIVGGRDGLLFESGSVEDLTLKLNKMLSLSDTERGVMGLAGREKVVKEYSWSVHMEKLVKEYSALL